MTSESESSYCSTCSESQYETSLSDTSLDDEDIDYTNLLRQSDDKQLFYLQLIDNKTSDESQNRKTDESKTINSESLLLTTNDRLRSSYTRLTSWVFNSKIRNKSFKRKSTKKKTISNPIETTSGDNPIIQVSDCDQNNSNKLFDLIEGKYETNVSKIDNKLILMYLKPPNETENDCLTYCYPNPESEDSKNPILLRLKGMFVTLSQVVSQITNQSINFASISANDDNEEQIYKISFIHESDSLLVLALPENRFTDFEVEAIIQTIGRVIKFNYNTLSAAFEDQSNHSKLTTIFSVVEYLLTEDIKYSIDSVFLNTIKRLLIDDELGINLNDSLSEYEAMDWLSEDSSPDIHQESSSQYVVIGSCLLYKGFLLTSHLPNHHLKDIYSFLSIRGLLSLHKSHSLRLVVWNQVFPSFDSTSGDPNDYNESEDVKYFVSIVGFQHMIHCTLLEMPFICSNETLFKANEVIINESIRLLKSHFTKTGLTDEVEHCFAVQQMTVKRFFDRKADQKRYKSLSSLKDLLSLSSSTTQLKQVMHRSTGSLSSFDESVSGSVKSRSSPSLQHSLLSRTSSSATSLSQSNSKDTSLMTCGPNNCVYLQQNFKLPENLICYLDIEEGQQIFAGPLLQWPKDICEQIFKKFAECCYGMSRQFNSCVDSYQELGKTFQIKISSNFLSPNKLKAKKFENEVHLFSVIARQHRNIEFYACFKTNGCDLMPIDFDIEDFIYSLRLQRRIS